MDYFTDLATPDNFLGVHIGKKSKARKRTKQAAHQGRVATRRAGRQQKKDDKHNIRQARANKIGTLAAQGIDTGIGATLSGLVGSLTGGGGGQDANGGQDQGGNFGGWSPDAAPLQNSPLFAEDPQNPGIVAPGSHDNTQGIVDNAYSQDKPKNNTMLFIGLGIAAFFLLKK